MTVIFYKNSKRLKDVEINIDERNDVLIWKEAPPTADMAKFKIVGKWEEIRRIILFCNRIINPLSVFQKIKFKMMWVFNPLEKVRWILINKYLNKIFNDAEIDYLGQLFQSPNKNILNDYKKAILNSEKYKLKKFDVTRFNNLGFKPYHYVWLSKKDVRSLTEPYELLLK